MNNSMNNAMNNAMNDSMNVCIVMKNKVKTVVLTEIAFK